MGRKIPAKKHRGVKDPLRQQAQRFERIKTKINAPPTDPDDQPVPRSVTRLFEFRDKKSLKNQKKKKSALVSHDIEKKPLNKKNPVNSLRRLPGESGREFSRRINSAVRHLAEPDELLHYPADIEEEDVIGARMTEERERRRIKHKRKEKAAASQEKAQEDSDNKSKTCRLALKKAAKKAKAAEQLSERLEVRYERVVFGEVAHAPPALPLPRRATAADGAPRPGRRELLLCKLLQPPPATPASACVSAAAAAAFPATLGAAERRRRERARLDAVAAYRALNKQKQTPRTVKGSTDDYCDATRYAAAATT